MAHNYDHAVVKYMGREGAKYAEGGAKLGSPPPPSCATDDYEFK